MGNLESQSFIAIKFTQSRESLLYNSNFEGKYDTETQNKIEGTPIFALQVARASTVELASSNLRTFSSHILRQKRAETHRNKQQQTAETSNSKQQKATKHNNTQHNQLK